MEEDMAGDMAEDIQDRYESLYTQDIGVVLIATTVSFFLTFQGSYPSYGGNYQNGNPSAGQYGPYQPYNYGKHQSGTQLSDQSELDISYSSRFDCSNESFTSLCFIILNSLHFLLILIFRFFIGTSDIY